jgi:hypothetical protein
MRGRDPECVRRKALVENSRGGQISLLKKLRARTALGAPLERNENKVQDH